MTGNRSLTEAKILAFTRAWYLALDQHAPAAECMTMVADDVRMIFPEKTLHGKGDFAAWYAGGVYSDGEKAPGVINIFFNESHNVVSVESEIRGNEATLEVVVAWQASWFVAPESKSRRVSLDAIQAWVVRATDKNAHGIEIVSYNAMAEPFRYAPGFSRL
jgi:hypothetical protein